MNNRKTINEKVVCKPSPAKILAAAAAPGVVEFFNLWATRQTLQRANDAQTVSIKDWGGRITSSISYP
ncbi:MAG: hypothetical protein M3Q33_13345 [Acidobacteriota bacterium]|nr:hypothetical protein [Acidobacteriota bacterium]